MGTPGKLSQADTHDESKVSGMSGMRVFRRYVLFVLPTMVSIWIPMGGWMECFESVVRIYLMLEGNVTSTNTYRFTYRIFEKSG